MADDENVKRVITVLIPGLRSPISIRLNRTNEVQALARVQASLEHHGWLQGTEPRALVRVGGVA